MFKFLVIPVLFIASFIGVSATEAAPVIVFQGNFTVPRLTARLVCQTRVINDRNGTIYTYKLIGPTTCQFTQYFDASQYTPPDEE